VLIKVLFFGVLKDVTGHAADQIDVPTGANVGVVFEHYAARFPKLRAMERSILLARNEQFARASESLAEGDEIALLPPVSGGSAGAGGNIFALTRQPIDTAAIASQLARGEDGARIWKLYNMGFIVRTKTATIAFDLVRGDSARNQDFALPAEIMNRLVDQCDALFISHRHGDHVDEGVAQRFLDQGKPVVAPPQVWAAKPIQASLTHLNREAHIEQALPIQKGKRELKVVVFPGHQMEKTENNVSLVITPEGLSFAHLCDQINEDPDPEAPAERNPGDEPVPEARRFDERAGLCILEQREMPVQRVESG